LTTLVQSLKKAASPKQLSFISPAKINLFFRVLYKREDDFHEIASLYQAISLCDILKISLSKEDEFTCSDDSLSMDENNLVCKALSLIRKKTRIYDPLKIHLEKRIPIQAGLGGGSSNAATLFFAFSQIFSLEISRSEFVNLGASLGSDVSFFFSSGSAYCKGRGEILEEVSLSSFFQDLPICIAKPVKGLSTPLVYRGVKPLELVSRDPDESLESFTKGKTPIFYNDLEESAFSVYPELKEIKQNLLDCGFQHVVMSGSGSSFFCIGKVSSLDLPGMDFFQVTTLQKSDRWYAL
jgi:4-diphosphocytidyl-2-C-methyl-D-erythritol kinase